MHGLMREGRRKPVLYSTRLFMPSFYSPEILQAAGIVVSVDDQKVGGLGADILLKNYLDANKKLGNEPVAMPSFKIWEIGVRSCIDT